MRHKVKGSDRVTFSLGETITPGDDNHLLPPQFAGGDILAFVRSFPAVKLTSRYELLRLAQLDVLTNDGDFPKPLGPYARRQN